MPVEIVVGHWNPERKRYRFEAFCHGPLSCPSYRAGSTRKVPARSGTSYGVEDLVNAYAVSRRGPDR